ncbi:MAG: hypothetical protein RLZZ143_3002 [Cyanobacteriota bacterium]
MALGQSHSGYLLASLTPLPGYLASSSSFTVSSFCNQAAFWFLIDGSAVGDHDFLVLINMYHLPVDFCLPSPSNNYRWLRIIDTAAWAETDYNCWSVDQGTVIADNYKVNGFSIVVCEEIN